MSGLYVKNASAKPIGFGKLVLLPDRTGELPEGFDERHPVVAFYLAKKYLEKADAAAEAGRAAEEAKEAAAAKAAEAEAARKEAEEAEAAAKAAETERQIWEVARMNLQPLRDMAKSLGLDFDEGDTTAALREKITARLKQG